MIPDAKEKCSILHLPTDPALHSRRLECSKKTLLLCNQQSLLEMKPTTQRPMM